MYVCGDADIGWGKSPIILRLNSLDKEKKTHCNPILAPVQHPNLLSVNREYLVGVPLLLMMMLMLLVIQSVRYLPTYLGMDKVEKVPTLPCITKSFFFLYKVQYRYSIGTV